jgi:maleylpyruvate isomerase
MSEVAIDLAQLEAAHQRLTNSVRDLDTEALRQPSHLPGWSRAHVLVHIANNAEGLAHLLLAARTGAELRMYSSPSTRAADLTVGVERPADVIVADVIENSFRFLVEARAMPAQAWSNTIAFTSGAPDPPTMAGSRVVELRREEVGVHHVDLDIGYHFSDTPKDLADQLIRNFAARRAVQGVPLNLALDHEPPLTCGVGGAPTITGSRADVLAWLAGRIGESLSADTATGALPVLPPLA